MPIKELARRVLPAPLFTAARAVRHRLRFGNLSHAAVFEKIHAENIWENDESVSGEGSTLASTAMLRGELSAWLAEHRPASFVDLPCGDFNWMQHVEFSEMTRYQGFDIVPALVAATQAKFGSASRAFDVADILTSDLPDADVYFCKDLFLHFPNAAIAEAVARVRPRCRWLMATHFPEVAVNEDIRFGGARRTNLALVLGPPVALLKDFSATVPDRYMGVWTGAR